MANAIEIAIPEGANFLERLVPPNMHGSAHMGPFIYLSNVLGMQEAWGISAREDTFDQRRKNNNEMRCNHRQVLHAGEESHAL